MNWLLVEDEAPKRDAIRTFISEAFPSVRLIQAKSVRAANHEIRNHLFTLLLLDMSLPTFEISSGEPGGRPQGFGGIEVMRFLEKEEIKVPVIVVTAYEAFPDKDGRPIGIKLLRDELERDFPTLFSGLIYFDPIAGKWTKELRLLINAIPEVT